MTDKERLEKILEAIELASKAKDILYHIVWEKQEGQENHFDSLPKSEQVALIGLLSNATNLTTSLYLHKRWFLDE